ncbi:MAG: hypothetical protein ABIF85_04440 [Nanoarchaeota archaeon]|nr:hypothetical protein [Nanoarchaeota archaeon]MBU4300009.1 hypothetical protein [Nanoarchaeota archaeon]MBU4451171.1 hypothetical protein [Nanoarchaeota archaeon]MCG2724314.1 hypothetical protein [archaeon]
MGGFFSKLITSLLGEKEEKPKEQSERLAEVKSALSSRVHARPGEYDDAEGESTIYTMIKKAYRRVASALSKKSNDRRAVAMTGVAVAVLITLLSYTQLFFYLHGTVLAIIFILIAAMSKLIQKLIPTVVGFDMCLFFTVLVGIAYHPLAGIAVGVLSSTLGSIIRGQYDMTNVIMPNAGYIAAGILLPFFAGSSIMVTGMVLTAVYIILMSIIFWFKYYSISNTATFVVTSLAFNYVLFSSYSTYFLKIMGVNG